MAMTWIWTAMVAVSVIFGLLTGSVGDVTTAALTGAAEAVKLCLAIAGVLCLWAGIMEIMNQSGLSNHLARLLRPVLSRLFPETARKPEAMEALSANVSANLLGLGNAATPPGIKAAKLMRNPLEAGTASNDLCMLVVVNTASIQLIPATVAGVRAAAGAAAPFDILPAVWLASGASVTAGVICVKLLSKWRGKGHG